MQDQLSNAEVSINPPLTVADFAYFARARYWKLDEVASLSLGVDPRSKDNVIGIFRNHPHRITENKTFCEAFTQLESLLVRNFIADDFATSLRPGYWVEWLETNRLPCPVELKAAVAEFDKETVDWKKRAKAAEVEVSTLTTRISELEKAIVDNAINSSVSTRERETMLKLIIGVAVEQYGFDPKKSRNEAAKQISDDLAGHGLSVSDDTVRKYLKEAAELLPPLSGQSP